MPYCEWIMDCYVCGREQRSAETHRNWALTWARDSGWRTWRTPFGQRWVCPDHERDPRADYIEIWGGPPGKEEPPRFGAR